MPNFFDDFIGKFFDEICWMDKGFATLWYHSLAGNLKYSLPFIIIIWSAVRTQKSGKGLKSSILHGTTFSLMINRWNFLHTGDSFKITKFGIKNEKRWARTLSGKLWSREFSIIVLDLTKKKKISKCILVFVLIYLISRNRVQSRKRKKEQFVFGCSVHSLHTHSPDKKANYSSFLVLHTSLIVLPIVIFIFNCCSFIFHRYIEHKQK